MINTREFNIYKALYYKKIKDLKGDLSDFDLLYCAFIIWFLIEHGYCADSIELDKDLILTKDERYEYYIELYPDFNTMKSIKLNQDHSITIISDCIIRLGYNSKGCIDKCNHHKLECITNIEFIFNEDFTYEKVIDMINKSIDEDINDDDIQIVEYNVIELTELGKQQLKKITEDKEKWQTMK